LAEGHIFRDAADTAEARGIARQVDHAEQAARRLLR
jgi:hypothetical protein